MRILGLVPARGGSKGVARKNARLIAGKPLLAWTADAARSATRLDGVILSTDDEELAEIGRECGLEVPFIRPAALATDTTPMIDVVLHSIDWADDDGRAFDALCLLQPTNPMRTAHDIDQAVELFERDDADTVFSVLAVPNDHHPDWVYLKSPDGSLRLSNGDREPVARRQDLPPAYHREGSIYLTRADVLRSRASLYGEKVRGFPIDADRSVNIDTPADWVRAETLLEMMS